MYCPNDIKLLQDKKFSNLRKKIVKFSFMTTANLPNGRNYFSKYFASELHTISDSLIKFVPCNNFLEVKDIDLILITAHGDDLSNLIAELKKINSKLVIAVWFFDNHLSYLNNFRTAILADIYFPSHNYCKDYLRNPFTIEGKHYPACQAQWISKELEFENIAINQIRKNNLLLNYVDYKFSWRSNLLNELCKKSSDIDFKVMPPDNRDRYFALSPEEKYREWCSYKSTLILPVEKDLSTRVFDALFAGQVLIVPTLLEDFDQVIPREFQNLLGIIRIKDLSYDTIKLAVKKSIEIFDTRGEEGIIERFCFVNQNHMLVNRVKDILHEIIKISS